MLAPIAFPRILVAGKVPSTTGNELRENCAGVKMPETVHILMLYVALDAVKIGLPDSWTASLARFVRPLLRFG